MATTSRLTVYHDGECPRCVRLARWLERRDRRQRLECVALQDVELPPGVSRHDALDELHVVDEDGRVLAGFDAAIAIASRVPVLRPLVACARLPGAARVGDRVLARLAGRRRCADCVDRPVRPGGANPGGPDDRAP